MTEFYNSKPDRLNPYNTISKEHHVWDKGYNKGYQVRDEELKRVVEAAENLLRDFSIDWYSALMHRSEKPSGNESGIKAKFWNSDVTRRMHFLITNLQGELKAARNAQRNTPELNRQKDHL